jgi:hypothetical protein
MKRALVFAIAASSAAVVGCGDNGSQCGPGTKNVDGVCTPTGGAQCGPGTVDDGTGTCVVAPGDCKDGTVLIGNECVDPTRGLMVDVEEGAEPNGIGVVEPSNNPAGILTLKAKDATLVVHGHITPFQDADGDGQPDPDFDTYVLQVDGPTLVDISVDGVGGAMGAFLALTDASNPAAGWRRFGLNIQNDTTKRQMLFPVAGVYAIAVADTRSMFLDGDSPPVAGAGGAAGGPDAEYYMSITVRDLPAPTAITVDSATGLSSTDGNLAVDKVDVYSVTGMGVGYNAVVADFPQVQSGGGLVLLNNNAFRAQSLETAGFFGNTPANVAAGGLKTGDQTIIVIDAAYNYGPDPAPYNIAIQAGAATALSTTGGTVTETEISNGPASVFDFNTFFYDAAAGDEIDGFKLHVSHPVDGVIADENLFILAKFTFDPFNGFVGNTFTDFGGLVRHPAAGRYYLVVYDPAGTPGTDTIDVTSTISAVTPAAVTENTPLTNQAVNTFNSMPFTYAAGNDPWQNFDITGVGTGARTADFFDPTLAYGSLDPIVTASGTNPADPAAIFTHSFAAAPSKIGRILLDDNTNNNYLVHVTTANKTGTVSLDFSAKVIHDFATVDAGNMGMAAAVTLDATTTKQFFLFRTAGGNRDTITATPVTGTLNTVVQRLNNDETALGAAINNGGAGAADSFTFPQSGNGWTAYSVSSATPLAAAATFDTTAKVQAPIMYNVADTTTALADACAGGTNVPFVGGTDDGITAALNAPAGFQFFGFGAATFKMSANGFLSFDPALAGANFTNTDLPDPNGIAPKALVAPYWDDLNNVVACTKASGTKLTIQWTGILFGTSTTVQFQAILDSSDNSIEFVYGTMQMPTGAGATIGVLDQGGANAKKIGFNMANAITVGAGKKLTPM